MTRRSFIWVLLLVSSCSLREQIAQTSFLSSSDRRQKQRVVVLQKKLDQAQKALAKGQEEVDLLQLQLCDAQLESIEQQIEYLERKWQTDPVSLSQALYQDASHLFLEEREALYRIVQTGFSMHRAQNLIDRILQLITQIHDCAVRAP